MRTERPLAAEEAICMRKTRYTPLGIGGLVALSLVAGALAGCGRGGNEQAPVKQASGPPGPPAAAAPGSQELSEDAKQITFVTRRAADRGNFVALRRFLADDFHFTGPDGKPAEHLNG